MSQIANEPTRIEGGVILTTPRTILRALRKTDVTCLHDRVFGDAEVMKWVFSGKRLTRSESETFICDNFSSIPLPIGLAVLAEKATGEILGFAGLNHCKALLSDDLEFGFVLAKQAWGRGLAIEIGHAQINFGFRQLRRSRLLALAAGQNNNSIRTLERLKLRYHSDVFLTDRAPRRVFCICQDEWLAQSVEYRA